MGAILVGIVILLLVNLLVVPYALWLIGTIVGVVLILWGLYVLFVGGGPPAAPGTRRRVRWY
jgi:hypothetical protein